MPNIFQSCELYELVCILQEHPDMCNNINEALAMAKQRVEDQEAEAQQQEQQQEQE